MTLSISPSILIKASSGQSVITDSVNSIQLSGGSGTASLYDDATHGLLWRITGGLKTAGFTSLGNIPGGTVTVAIRFRITGRLANYQRFFIVGDVADQGVRFGNSGTTAGVLNVGWVNGANSAPYSGVPYTDGNLRTLVFKCVEGTADTVSTWINQTSRANSDPDYTASGGNLYTSKTWRYMHLGVASTEVLDVFDVAFFVGGLTDSECAALADDVRGQLYSAPDVTAGLPTFANSQSVVTASGMSIAQGGLLTAGNSQSIITASGIALAAATPVASITLPKFSEWETGNLLPGETGVTVWINDDVSGALVAKLTGQTSHATTAVCTVSHAALVAETDYHVRVKLTSGAQASWTLTAA